LRRGQNLGNGWFHNLSPPKLILVLAIIYSDFDFLKREKSPFSFPDFEIHFKEGLFY
jgi:hypothetical protein